MTTEAYLIGHQIPLVDALLRVEPRPEESRLAFLGRLQYTASNHTTKIIAPEQFQILGELLPEWSIWHGGARRDYVAAERLMDDPRVISSDDIMAYTTERRLVGAKEPSSVAMLAKTAFLGEDLGIVIRIEKAITKNVPAGPKEFAFRPRELDIISRLGETYEVIAEKLGISTTTISTSLWQAQKRGGMTRRELVSIALEQDMVDLSSLPAGDTSSLTPRQIEIIKLAFENNDAIGEALGISGGTVGRHWSRILERTGAGNRVRAFLMVKRDGRI